MATHEYLKGFSSDLLATVSWKTLLRRESPIEQKTLRQFLIEANNFLTTEPGPNLIRRRTFSDDWLGWWIRLLDSSKKPGQITQFEMVSGITQTRQSPKGVLFCGGLEGHRGHRWAVMWVHSFTTPILLFEQDEYLEQKDRGGAFLPLAVRLSMWAYYSQDSIISVLPARRGGESDEIFYKRIFDQTGADYHFATEGDPYQEQKRARGKPANFTLIPMAPNPRTTDMVQKLMPDI